ncbi:ABC transporter substrate-binding protein [Halorubrum ezzemoulense]|jgi:ABC-type transport system substrate-binding protein|uniref:ABC transporter substrate-binding protein n=2 Tax=Halorubrum ezzemoulense TaxID=337243 RepID=A0A256JNP7_HALEZ|nr:MULTISPECIES: ABC transporter substrate-binding protein [Halorubrum]MDB2236549.1 ABC transporter substrate-binding protein [Halorubrum ezzemoulense]MDB2244793.1 ABC transporter substrate-binding protein [Halorubrum ezzemoulense]MDB2248163.1 ABC transporter substrate-binding protein [Halorubrum ezzemoulense]MDB2251000.1 ABC transporter substrate-binding protein [Halorubrum ezzemoulense]MDB2259677.1 ABC transporter substrate-binding protein [Halorubrum ezzemoulense]
MPRRNIENRDDSRHIGRRQWLSALGLAGAVTLAGCSGNGGDGSDGSDGGGGGGGEVEVPDFPRFGVGDLYGSEVARNLAREAFEESEYDYGFDGDVMVNPEGDQVEIDIYHSAASETNQLLAEFIAQELENNLGISVTPEAIDGTRFSNEYYSGDPEGGTDTVNGEEVEWSNPGPRNPGPRSVTSNEAWDMSVNFGLNTYPLNPLTNQTFFDGANANFNPVGYYPQFDVESLFEQARQATSRDEIRQAFVDIFANLAREQPYIMLTLGDDIIGYNPDLTGPIENFSNGWDLPAWHIDDPSVSGSYDTVTGASFNTLNPLYNNESGAGTAIERAIDPGYTFDENQEYFPLLYDMSTEDGEVWTFELRDNLQFSEPYGQVTAEDFVYQIQEVQQADWANTADSDSWEGVEVEQTGELEFEATLETSNVLWPQTYDPYLYPIPRALLEPYVEEEDVEGLQQDEELLELQFSGNLGPFELEEWNRGSGTEYVRNDEYYLRDIDEGPDLFSEGPLFEEASISVVQEQASRLGALETGEADAAAIPPEQYESYSEDDNVTVRQVPTPYNTIISVNQRANGWNTGPGNMFQLVPFRQAMAAAIGKEELIQGVYRGLASSHFTWQPRWSEFYPSTDE